MTKLERNFSCESGRFGQLLSPLTVKILNLKLRFSVKDFPDFCRWIWILLKLSSKSRSDHLLLHFQSFPSGLLAKIQKPVVFQDMVSAEQHKCFRIDIWVVGGTVGVSNSAPFPSPLRNRAEQRPCGAFSTLKKTIFFKLPFSVCSWYSEMQF